MYHIIRIKSDDIERKYTPMPARMELYAADVEV